MVWIELESRLTLLVCFFVALTAYRLPTFDKPSEKPVLFVYNPPRSTAADAVSSTPFLFKRIAIVPIADCCEINVENGSW